MLRNVVKGATRKAITELSQYPKPGEKLHGFTLLRTKHVPELELTALHLRHDKTGADYLHIAREDSNNVFSIGFKTNPPDDTGVPHILEHTTLCGSQKYPIRDPFFKMLPRTLSNFMNAFTASDTYYPFATTNAQDFQNLMSVYLDSTLHPLLKETDFTQEGWRIGPENPRVAEKDGENGAEDSKLVFKGVVYNEMKGQMSDAGYLFYIRFQDHIFPSINNSGGDPQKITDLTYEQLRKFHAEHYHPSNAKLITYGDMPLADHLKEVDAQMKAFEKIQADIEHKKPIDLSEGPRTVTVFGPVDPLADPEKQYKTYGNLSIGLSGVEQPNVEKIKGEIQNILREVRDKGFERTKIEGYLHQLELSLKHKTANFGLSVLHRLKGKWFSGTDPFDSLAWNDTVAAFEAKLAEGGYLEGLMDKYLLNDNTLTFTMAPSETYGAEIAKEEDDRLLAKISEATQQAGGEQEVRKFFEQRELDLLVEQNKSNTEDLNELRSLVPLFTDAIMRLGTKDMTMEQLEDQIKLKTGGISVSYLSTASPTDFRQASEGLLLRGTALDRNVPEMFDLLRKLISETNFDSPEAALRIRQLLEAAADGVVNDIASSGHSYARRYAESGLTREGYLAEQVSGLSQVKLITSLAGRPESDQFEDIIEKLKQIQKYALAGTDIRTALTCGSDSVQANFTALSRFLASRSTDPVQFPVVGKQTFARDIKAFFPLPYQVYYGSLALPTTSYTSAQGAPLQILAQLLTHKHLHHEIREKGGAYGGGAYMKGLEGIFGFYSYRDPNPQNTLSIMKNAGRWAVDKKWSDRDLEEAKISVFQSVDAPRSVSAEGMLRFMSGVTDEMQQKRREQLLDVSKDQVREAAQKYIVDALANGEERITFLGKKQDWVDNTWKVNEINVDSTE
ncbi:Mitochondrial presequence protease [Daldinia childiae]|uniref:Mitochondrial presequence protease n=1 Tax=Daldinia childiae TaxID=326645 RepID=UPI0014487562|nr:Mitochondrial presequence protease [Daldinia childiae]KAF3064031.1 Mitochondrial presequence protease [Daldinia childiae]